MGKAPSDIGGDGIESTYYHLSEWVDHVRLQTNGDRPLRLKSVKEIRKIARWLTKYADSKKRSKRSSNEGESK